MSLNNVLSVSTTVKVLDGKKEVASHHVNKGEVLTIKADGANVNYQLINDATGLGPQNIITKREGNNLVISLEDGDTNPDIIIENYYGENGEATDLIVGQHENGKFYSYVPESGLTSDAISVLAEEVTAAQALGGSELASPFWFPWWALGVAALIAGGIALAAGGGGKGGSAATPAPTPAVDTTAPSKPTVVANSDGSITITPSNDPDVTKTTVTYIDENGNTHTSEIVKGQDGNWTTTDSNLVVDPSTGVVTIPADKVKDGSEVSATNTDAAGNTGEKDTATAENNPDTTPPSNPDVVANNDGSVTVKLPNDPDATKTTVTYTDENGNEKTVTFTKDPTTGKWVDDNPNDNVTLDPTTGTVTIPADEVKDGTDVTAVTEDKAGNKSNDKDTAKEPADVTPPANPDVVANNDGSVTVKLPNDPDATKTTVTYTDENGNEKTVTFTKDPTTGKWVDDNPNDNVTLDPTTGTVTIPEDEVKDGTDVTAVTEDKAGNKSEDKDTAKDVTPPSEPTVEIVGAKQDGKIDPADVDSDGKVTVKVTPPADAEVGDTVTVTGPNGQTVTETLKDTDGDGKPDPVEVKITPAKDGETTKVTAIVTDKANNPSNPTEATADTDTKVPGDSDGDGVADEAGKPVVVIADNDDGKINPADVDADGKVAAKITFPADSGYSVGDTVKITGQDGNTVLERELTQEDLDNGIDVKVTPAEEGKETKVTTVVTDGEGNSSLPGEDTSVTDLKVPGDSDGDGVADEAGKPVVVIADNDDGTIDPADVDADGKVDAKVTFPADAGYSVGDTVKITDQDGNTVLERELTQEDLDNGIDVKVTPAEEGKDTVVTAVVTDGEGNSSLPGDDTSVTDLKVPGDSDGDGVADDAGKPVVVIADNDDGKINPADVDADGKVAAKITFPADAGYSVGDTVKITDQDGNTVLERELTQEDLDNGIDVKVTPAEEGKETKVTTVVTDGEGNSSLPGDDTSVTDLKVPGDSDGDGVADDAGKPVVVIADNDDGKINPADVDADGKVDAKVTFPADSGYSVGDSVKITDQDGNTVLERELTQEDLDNGIDVKVTPAAEGEETTVTAVVTDPQGNSTDGQGTSTTDLKVPGDSDGDGVADDAGKPVVVIADNDDGKINPDDVDADGKVDAKVTFPADAGYSVGDTVVITDQDGNELVNRPLTQEDLDNGIDVKVTPAAEGEETTVTAVVTDPQGNSTDGQDTSTTDLKVPGDSDGDGVADEAGKPSVVIADGNDGKINPADVGEDGKVDAKVTFPADSGYSVGDTVKITDQDGNELVNRPLTQEDLDNGIDVKVTPAEEGKETKVTTVVTDGEGNSSLPGEDTSVTDLKVPGDSDGDGVADDAGKPVVVIADNDDGKINPADVDADGKVDAKVTFPADSGYSVGDTVKITDQDGNTVLERELTQEDLDNGIDVKVTPAAEGEETTVTAVVTDAEGNSSTEGKDTSTTDLKVPGDSDGDGVADDAGKPVVVIADNDDGKINPADVDADGKVDAKVTFPADAGYSVGDTVVITDQDGNELVNRPLTQEDLDNGIDVKVTPAAEGEETTVTAVVTDPQGNSTAGQDTSTTDLKVPGDSDGDGVADDEGKPVVVIADKDDGKINPTDVDADGKVDAKVTFPADAGYSVGDTVVITDQDGNELVNRPLTQEDLDNGIDVKVTPAAEDEETTVTAVVTDPEGNESLPGDDTSVTDLEGPATEILPNSVKMGDNLTDETPDAVSFYPNQDETPYVGEIASVAGDDYNVALSLDTGLTNDTTPTLNFSLDNPVVGNQTVEVTRYVIVDGVRAVAVDVTDKLVANGKDYTLTDELGQTYGKDYEYVIELKEDGEVISEQSHKIRLDTLVEAMDVTKAQFDDSNGSASVVLAARENSDKGATISYKYTAGGREITGSTTDNGTGIYELDLQGFNRKDPAGLQLTIVDAAGNITTQKVNFIRNLFSDYNLEQGPDTSANTFDDANRLLPRQQTSAADETAIKATDGNDTLIVGLEQFGGFGALNGSVADEGGMLNPRPTIVDTGAGDDFIHVRGAWQGFEHSASKVLMGEGNDKIKVDENLTGYVAAPEFNVDMGNGDNIIQFKGHVGGTIITDVTFGDGNDLFIIGSNFDGLKTVNFGEGNNTLQIGGYLVNGFNSRASNITFGAGNDVMTVSSNVDNIQTTIDLGDGNNYYEVGGDQRTATVISGAGDDTVLIKGGLAYSGNLGATTNTNSISTGAGNDEVTIQGQSYRGLIDLGEGDDTLTIGKVYLDSNPNQLQFNGGDGNDTIYLAAGDEEYSMRTIKNFETIDMAESATKQTLRVEINHLLESDSLKEIYIKAGAEDVVKLGTANDNLNDTLTGTGRVVWAKVDAEQKVVDGVTYDAYTVTQTDEWVYIQQGIQVI